MIDLYAFPTPNSIKVPVLLEELGADYRYAPINVRAGEQTDGIIRRIIYPEVPPKVEY